MIILMEVFSMSFLEKIKSRRLAKAVAAVATGGMLFLGGGDALAAPNDNASWKFRQAYLEAPQNNNIFHQVIVFFGTTFHVDTESYGQILIDGSMRMGGNINWEYTDPSNNITTNNNIPFFVTHNDDEMMLYVQRDNRWSRFSMPGLPISIANALKSTDINTLKQNLSAVKSVELFRETDKMQIFNVTLDGDHLSNILQRYERTKDTTGLSADEIVAQRNFLHNLNAAVSKTDIVCTWTVDKKTHETITAVVDLTPLMRAYAQNVLDEAAAGTITISDEDRLLMETIGYYSEFHYSVSYSGTTQNPNMTPPRAARRASVNNNVFSDFFKDMTTSVKR